MHTDRAVFITALFQKLLGAEYLWLKAVHPRPEATPDASDIDIFVKERDLPGVLLFVSKQDRVAKCEAIRKASVTFLHLTFQDGSYLKLDLLTALVRKQYCYLPESVLFANRIWNNGVAVYTHELLLEHALLFNFLNHAGLPAKYIGHFEAMTTEEQARLLAYINGKYGTAFTSIAAMSVFSKKERKNMVAYLGSLPENHLLGRTHRFAKHCQHHFGKKRPKAPRIITFTGVDGAGKTTLLNDLRELLTEKLNHRVVVLRHRPSLLPIISAYKHGKKAAEAKSVAALPRQGNNASTVSSLFRFGYYFADYLFGQAYIYLRYQLPGHTVIYDRYYFDFIVDAKRSNISLGEALPKWLYRFVAKPGLNVFLYADPDTIRQRKQELPKADIERMTGQYRALFGELGQRYGGRYICIENTDRNATFEAILAHYFTFETKEHHHFLNEQTVDFQEVKTIATNASLQHSHSSLLSWPKATAASV